MSSLDRFPVKLADIGACPERFQASLRNAVDQSETINTLIYCPPYPSGRTSLPGSVLCLTDRQWVIVHDAKRSRPPIVKQALYDDTLFVELKIVLLYGCLKIHFAKGDRSESAECYFNTVMEQMFSGVIETIHNRIDQLKFAPKEKDAGIRKHWEGWSFKFQNYCQDYLPPGSQLSASLYWPTVFGLFRRELAPAGAFLLTDRHLMSIAEHKSWFWSLAKDETKYGATFTYFPRSRISSLQIHEYRRINILELTAHAAHGAEQFQVPFPTEETERIKLLLGELDRASSQHAEKVIG
jgi:hypothetical protein